MISKLVQTLQPLLLKIRIFTFFLNLVCRSQGPFDLLIKYFRMKQRVRIYTRGAHGIRGYCDCYIKAFDRHFNLILNDVFEKYGRLEWQNSDVNELEESIINLNLKGLHEPIKPIADAIKQV